MNDDAVRAALRMTKALADLQRVRILMMLRQGELCVCQIVEVLGLAPSTVSKHLSLLSAAGLLSHRKDGRWAYYQLPEGPAAAVAQPLLTWLDTSLRRSATVQRDAKALASVLACDPEVLCRRQRAAGT